MTRQLFSTSRTTNFKSTLYRWVFHLVPSYRSTGARVKFISSDWQEVHIGLRLKLRTRNLVGSVFGGSIYAATDPIYMTQLMFILGKDYVVWDKAAEIKFIKPIYKKAFIKFEITDEQLQEIKTIVQKDGRCNYEFTTQFVDAKGTVYAEVRKVLYVATKEFYKARLKEKVGKV